MKKEPQAMVGRLTNTKLEAALEDLNHRTLAKIGFAFGRLIYLASTRDCNTGRYYHDGLAFQFSEEIASKALAQAHREVFFDLALSPLKELAQQVQLYIQSVGAESEDIIRGWEKLEPYRVAIPIDADSVTAGLFVANVKIALAIVESRLEAAR
ncbi:MAG: hypothetical protein WBU20_14820 [Candidatus Acidiferrum sp.]